MYLAEDGKFGRDGLAAVCACVVKQKSHMLLRCALMKVSKACGAEEAADALADGDDYARHEALSLMFLTSEQGKITI